MRSLTELPSWAGITIMLLADVVAVSLLMAHEQKQTRKLLRSERKRLKVWAETYAEQRAEELYQERLRSENLKQIGR